MKGIECYCTRRPAPSSSVVIFICESGSTLTSGCVTRSGLACCHFWERFIASFYKTTVHLTELNPSLFLSASSQPCFMAVDSISTLTSSMGFLWSFFHSCSLRLMRNVVFLSAFHIKDTVRCQPGEFCPPVTLFVTGLVVLSASLIENHHKTSKTRSTCLPELMPHMKHWNTDEEVSFKRTWKTNKVKRKLSLLVVKAFFVAPFCEFV